MEVIKKLELNAEEYTALRAEIISRQEIINSQAINALTFVLAMWVAGFTLLGLQAANKLPPNSVYNIFLPIGQMVSFLAAIFLLIPMAVKSGENLQQIASIGTYILVFYEEAGNLHPEKCTKRFYWETADKKKNSVILEGKSKSRIKAAVYNADYMVLALISNLYYLLAVADFAVSLRQFGCSLEIFYSILFLLALLEVAAIAGIVLVGKASAIKRNMQEKRAEYIEVYARLAVEQGIVTKEDADKIMVRHCK